MNAGTSTLLLPTVKAFQRRFPGASVEIRNLQQDEIQRDLANGALDLVLITRSAATTCHLS